MLHKSKLKTTFDLKNALNIPIIWNWDIKTPEDAFEKIKNQMNKTLKKYPELIKKLKSYEDS